MAVGLTPGSPPLPSGLFLGVCHSHSDGLQFGEHGTAQTRLCVDTHSRTFEKVKVKTNVRGSDKRKRRKAKLAAASSTHPPPLAPKKGSVGQTLGDWTRMTKRSPLRGT
ncbi:hypothetical protein JTB14_031055 [Gonioctena quinquepunctata]|nr:hypothetical protein JTB14_031055 [Gonioctena quinquepunctata]